MSASGVSGDDAAPVLDFGEQTLTASTLRPVPEAGALEWVLVVLALVSFGAAASDANWHLGWVAPKDE